MNTKEKWQLLNPLDPGPRYKTPRGTLLVTVIVAVTWAALLVILISNWAVPVAKVVGS